MRALAALAVALALPVALALAESPEVVRIVEPALGGAAVNPADVHMEAEFADADGDGHLCTDWEIRTVPGEETTTLAEVAWQAHCVTSGQEKLHIHLGDGQFVGSYAGRDALLPDAEYELRVRFKDDSGEADEWSEWAQRLFRTKSPGAEGTDSPVPWLARPGYSVEVFATGLQLPVNIAMVPNPGPHPGDPLLYVAELYGTIKVVSRDGTVRDYATGLLNFNPTGSFPGSGEMGLTGLAVDPGSGDLFASLLREDGGLLYPTVIRLHSDESGNVAEGQTTVLAMDEPQGASHQISNLTIGPDDNLYVHSGDGGNRPAAAQADSYLGKILRMTPGGEPLADNPFFDSGDGISAEDYVWAYGLRNPFGGAWRLADGAHFMVENGPTVDRLAKVVAGEDYGWPADETMSHGAAYNWVPSHAPVNVEFVEPARFGGSGFPLAAMGHAFVTESGATYEIGPRVEGKRISEFGLDASGGLTSGPETLVEYTGTGRATAIALAAGADGLYFTDFYKDQDYESPIDRGSNVLLVRYCGDACPTEEELPPTAPSPPGPSAPDTADRSAPQVLGFRVERGVFAVGGGSGPRAAPQRGTAFLYRLTEPAAARIEIHRLGHPGPRGTLVAGGRAGANRRPFGGFLGRHPLPPGRYRATIRASDAGGNRSTPRSLGFRVVSRARGRAQ